ncbi:hypothetical protein Tco_0912119 [Tanacetum coccineum]
MDKGKTGLGYNAVPPPYTGNFMPPKPNLVYPSLDDFVDVKESVVEKSIVETNKPKTVRKENGAPIIEGWVFESEEEDEPKFQTVKPNFTKIELVKPKTDRKPVNQIRQDTYSPSLSPRGNKRNWNQQMSQKLGSDFETFNKAYHVCGPMKNVINNAYSTARRPFNKIIAANNSKFTKKVNTVKGNPHQELKDTRVIDSGCSRHMTGNKSYLTDYEETNGGFVAFGGNSKGGKITRKDKIRIGKLDF